LAAHIAPVLLQLGFCNQDAISNLLRGSGQPNCHAPVGAMNRESSDDGSDLASPTVRWMAGVYLADELTSFVRVRDGSSEGHVETTLFVDAKWRRQGIGTLLLEATMDWASRHQAGTLRLVCARTDWPMRHFARKFGARLDLVLGQLVADIPLGQRIHEQHRASSTG
jgi:GNAT superfamily N-acetyltransferase